MTQTWFKNKEKKLVYTLTIVCSDIPPPSFHMHLWWRGDIPVPCGSALLGVTRNPLSCVPWVLLLLLPQAGQHWEKVIVQLTIYPGKGISQLALEDKCHEVVMVHAVSSATSPGTIAYVYNSVLSVGHLPVMVGVPHFLCTASKQHFHFISIAHLSGLGYPQLSVKSWCLFPSGFLAIQTSMAIVLLTLLISLAVVASLDLLQVHLPE